MKIGFKNFANAGNGTLCIKDLTVIFGPNNSGKTYINYAIYSILSNFQDLIGEAVNLFDAKDLISELNSKGSAKLNLSAKLNRVFNELKHSGVNIIGSEIHQFFQVSEEYFADTEFTVILDELDLDASKSDISSIGGPGGFSYNYEYNCMKQNRSLNITSYQSKKENDSTHNLDLLQHSANGIIYQAHFSEIIPIPFAVTSERTGVSLFYKTFDNWNSKILKYANQRTNSHRISMEDLNSLRSLHALPIESNIDNLRFCQNLMGMRSAISMNEKVYKEIVEILSVLLDDGTFESVNDSLFYRTKENSGPIATIPLHATSSSVKSLFLLDLFIKNIALKNSILIIDEPELNLCVDNQILMSRLVARLVNAGVKVLITTHSDSFIREINNLITLSSANEKVRMEKMSKFGFKDCDLLRMDQVSAYKTSTDRKIKEMEIFKSGIDSEFWDESNYRENKKSEEIYYASEVD